MAITASIPMMNPHHARQVARLAFVMAATFSPSVARPQHATAPHPSLQEYAIDAGHSIVEFSIGFALSRVKGRFTQWHGTILYDSLNPGNSSITAVIETKSI